MLVAAVQTDIVWHDPAANRAVFERMLDDARLDGRLDGRLGEGALVVLPELGDVGFTVALDEVTPSDAPAWAARTAKARGLAIAVGYPRRADDGLGRNECAIARPDGSLSPAYAKVHPFGFGRETEAYRGGERIVLTTIGPFTVCPLVCYDLRFPELWRLATLAGAELFVIGASWPVARQQHWRALLIARAIENQAYVVACNRVGSDPSLRYGGGSIVIGPTGEVLAEAADEPTLITAECDHEALLAWRRKFPALRDVHRALLGDIPVERA
ncbi:MAG: nitrilase-related carbon-nitrogen hydrolase [Phycisphaerae bacterium]|nr:nitrilase-related carbon-nitrogen hydrolase [Phycisphaerae bacterium]